MVQQIDKPYFNEEFRVCDFSAVLDSTDSITSPSIVVFDKNSVDVTADMISDVSIFTGNKGVRYKLKGGLVGLKYKMEIRIATASLQKFEEPFTVCIV